MKYGCFGVMVESELPEEQKKVLSRFAIEFERTYTRFLDLKKAEAQAREAQIEAALERVRSRTMAMQRSDELKDAAVLLFQQVQMLGVHPFACGFNIWDEDRKAATAWMSRGTSLQVPFKYPTSEDVFVHILEAAEKGEFLYVKEQSGEELDTHYRFMATIPVFREMMEQMAQVGLSVPSFQIIHCAFFSQGFLMFITYEPAPYAYDIFKRFAKVFEQTYTRFLDLQKSEAQAVEAIKRASVDRVRAEIASMRSTSDLERITPLIWNELKTLGVPFIRCGVFIMDEEQQQVNTYLSNPEGEAIAAFHQPYNTPGEIAGVVQSWRKKEMYNRHWDEARFIAFTNDLVQQGAITSGEKYLTENRPTDLYLHFLPFLQGMLYVGNTALLSSADLNLVQNLADAFSTAYARYEDFNKLETAKGQVDRALTELKQTQAQLVQTEKMASLGELTAGIAHEIQNPLNFVNNFSEINQELIGELREEIDRGKMQEAGMIAESIRENEAKISLHGKRADAIVKGMLQHSRSAAGQVEETELNALCEEYLRLAFHGYRAKENTLSVALETDFDPGIGKVSVITQDIGRVLLNLYNNAFYAVSKKEKTAAMGYEPRVSVLTRKHPGYIEIVVRDNGMGIPEKIREKIFQPFFTTKPTGQGTGLGLSLSYDIVKAHGGELKLVTKENEGAEFVILLPVTS
jgi:signal transduction histidine kinase